MEKIIVILKKDDGDYNIINMSNLFNMDYADNTALLKNNKNDKQKIVSLRAILNGKRKYNEAHSLTNFNHSLRTNLNQFNTNNK